MNASVVNTILERSQGCCEAMLLQSGCNGRGEHIHHRRLRSQGGGDTATNCVHICHKCHDYIHYFTIVIFTWFFMLIYMLEGL